jgi:hypothetical protein
LLALRALPVKTKDTTATKLTNLLFTTNLLKLPILYIWG